MTREERVHPTQDDLQHAQDSELQHKLDLNPSKVVNFMVLFLDICAVIIHIDLYMVTKYKRRLFTPILEWKIISQKQLSPYATAYRTSL